MTANGDIRVIVGMSGGVDSSVAAALLLEDGFSVEGLFMKNWDEDDGTEYCTAIEDLQDAQTACEQLGIHLHTANFSAEYWDNVFTEFLEEYRSGRTPNPDIACNREIKFKQFVDYASLLGADYIATGHYATAATQDGEFVLQKGVDPEKDQSYFLQAVPRAALAKCKFPLGGLLKSRVRELALAQGLHNHARRDSTGICFIGERRFADFLSKYVPDEAGPIADDAGVTLGEHRGLHYYTIGQRQGINLGGIKDRAESPWYVIGKANESNTLYVSQDQAALDSNWLFADEINWLKEPTLPFSCTAKIRYRQQDQLCRVDKNTDGKIKVEFDVAQRAVSPGQYIAFYDGDVLLGGGKIVQREIPTPPNLEVSF